MPVHALLGKKVHETTPLSWWNIDTPAADMAAECKLAYDSGYLAYKTKGRPWFDIDEQLRQATAAVPEAFKIDMDFNATLLDAERGIPILRRLEKYAHVDIYESPIPQGDIEGNRRIRQATRVDIALHYDEPEPAAVIREGVCDGFVIGGGASELMRCGAFSAEAGLPFWLQVTGSDITAAWSLHFGGVLSHAVWPAVNCHQLFTDSLLTGNDRGERGAQHRAGPSRTRIRTEPRCRREAQMRKAEIPARAESIDRNDLGNRSNDVPGQQRHGELHDRPRP